MAHSLNRQFKWPNKKTKICTLLRSALQPHHVLPFCVRASTCFESVPGSSRACRSHHEPSGNKKNEADPHPQSRGVGADDALGGAATPRPKAIQKLCRSHHIESFLTL